MNSLLVRLLALVVCLQLSVVAAFKTEQLSVGNLMDKRDIKQEWEDLGWAWGKRSDPQMLPRRYLRALHPMKKNPDWGDLGWTWGRK